MTQNRNETRKKGIRCHQNNTSKQEPKNIDRKESNPESQLGTLKKKQNRRKRTRNYID